MSPRTITADGMEWPLETFIAARGFAPFDYDAERRLPALATSDVPCEMILRDGTLRTGIAINLPWHDALAYKAEDGRPAVCDGCGAHEVDGELISTDGGSICPDCYSWGGC